MLNATVDSDAPDTPLLGPTVGNLPSANGPLISITPQTTFDAAITIMLLNDFSQLPVLSGPRQVLGAVSWRSIAQARNINPQATLRDAVVPVPVVSFDADLVELLPQLLSSDFVLVATQSRVVDGIVTIADVVEAYGELATPFMLIGTLDQLFRAVVAERFTLAEIATVCNPDGTRPRVGINDLTIGDYQQVLSNQGFWDRLSWSLDRQQFIHRLNEIRVIRNDIMHFNPDPVTDDTISKLRHFINLLSQYTS